MPTLLQINSTANWGSTGRIAEQIGERAIAHGWDSYIAYGRYAQPSKSHTIKIGSTIGVLWHVLVSRLFDRHGLASRLATRRFIRRIRRVKPDIVHLHNIHGYYLDYRQLFDYLQSVGIPVVWTLHDCWAFTGHCAHYVDADCQQWQSVCRECVCLRSYPRALRSRVTQNHRLKKRLFLSLGDRLTLVPVSKWLASQAERSFFGQSNIHYIYNGIDVDTFAPRDAGAIRRKYDLEGRFTIIGVASAWSEAKGLSEFVKLRERLPNSYAIVLVGLSDEQLSHLPDGIIGIGRTQSQRELAKLYSAADVVLSLSRAETFGLTVVEGMACGTPAIVYNRTAVPELVTPETGIVVERVGDIDGLIGAIGEIKRKGKRRYSKACRARAVEQFDKNKCFDLYLKLYDNLIKQHTK